MVEVGEHRLSVHALTKANDVARRFPEAGPCPLEGFASSAFNLAFGFGLLQRHRFLQRRESLPLKSGCRGGDV